MKLDELNMLDEKGARREGGGFLGMIDILLKSPKKLVEQWDRRVTVSLLISFLGCMFVFGFVNGLFSGGMQILYSSVKYPLGLVLSGVICFPSLYIFLVLAGANVSIKKSFCLLLLSLSLSSVILLGLAPVLWVFTQSTLTLGFIGFLNVLFWLVAVFIGFRWLFEAVLRDLDGSIQYFKIWMVIFLFVVFQMSTTLRPLVGSSDRIFTSEKKFFYFHWLDSLDAKNKELK